MIEIIILGGIRLEGLDRMRVTLKVQVEHLSLRHNLDLYNDNQTEKLIRKIAERLEIGTSVAAAVLTDLTDELEKYRLQEIEKQQTIQDKRKFLDQKEIKAAKEYLSAPNLMERTGQDIGRAGVIGEADNQLLMYLIFTSRKRETPLHVISLGSSGIGKTHLQEKVSALIPEEDKLEITTLSGNALYYFGQQELRHKLILIEDLDGAEEVLYPLREIKSKKRITKRVVIKNTKGETRTVNLVVEGPVSVAGCTTRESIYEDNANRSLLLHLDGSREQDKRIMEYHKKVKAGLIDTTTEEQIREKLKNMQRALQPVKVVNPWSLYIDLPQEVMNPRRTLPLLLGFIEAVTFSHQYQREKQYDQETGEEFIETTPEDIEIAFKLLRDVLFRKSDELSGACRKFYDWVGSPDRQFNGAGFYASEIRQEIQIHPRTLHRYLSELTEYGRLQIIGGNKHKTGYQYALTNYSKDTNLRTSIDSKVEKIIEQVNKVHASRPGKSRMAKNTKNGK